MTETCRDCGGRIINGICANDPRLGVFTMKALITLELTSEEAQMLCDGLSWLRNELPVGDKRDAEAKALANYIGMKIEDAE